MLLCDSSAVPTSIAILNMEAVNRTRIVKSSIASQSRST